MPSFLDPTVTPMPLWLVAVLFAVGLVLIIKGGDWFVNGASWIAEISGIPKFIIGATVVSLATTLPEMLTSLFATLDGNLDIASGNAIGSVTANVGLIMGISILCAPVKIDRRHLLVPATLMILSTALLLVCALGGGMLTIVPIIILLLIFLAFMGFNVVTAKKDSGQSETVVELKSEKPKVKSKDAVKNIAMLVVGAAFIVIGAQFLQTYGKEIAMQLGVPENIIGITIIAIGTSLPELVTMITALVKKQSELSVGNIIGANVFDLTLILAVCAFSSGGTLQFNADVSTSIVNMVACLGIGLLGVVPAIIGKRFYRWQGVALLMCYAGYLVYSCVM